MKILLTGTTGYITQRLLPVLLQNGHQVVCCLRDKKRFTNKYGYRNITLLEADFLHKDTLQQIPGDIEAAYYLIHSMATQQGDFEEMKEICALYFIQVLLVL